MYGDYGFMTDQDANLNYGRCIKQKMEQLSQCGKLARMDLLVNYH